MHMISKITVENYKSIVKSEFPLSAYTPLVGYNNAGKTNILNALNWLVKKSSLPASDFHDPERPVIVTGEVSGITGDVLDAIDATHRKRIEPLVADGKLHVRRTQLAPNAKASEIRFEIWKIDGDGDGDWELNPTGIDAAISYIFPEPIFIGAMENATEDVGKFAAGTTIGKLMKEIIGPVTEAHSMSVSQALADVGDKLSADSPNKDEALVSLDRQIQAELQRFFPGVTAKTHIPTPEFADFLKGATIKLFEADSRSAEGRDASSFGHGAQRSVQIALIKCLSEIKRGVGGADGRTTLLLIDEPELYLHPQAIELVRSSLSRLASEGYQVAFSTHSASMIARVDAPNALLIRRNGSVGTRAYPRIKDAVSGAIEDAAHQAETLFALTNAVKILFSERVVLAEGKTEQAILPDTYRFVRGKTIDEDRTGLVALGGSSNVPNAMKVLAAMGIPSRAVVDLDFAFKEAPKAGLLPGEHAAIRACKETLRKLYDEGKIGLDETGLPQAHNGVSAAKAFELLALNPEAAQHIQMLHSDLRDKNIWLWTLGAIEAHLGLASKKTPAHMGFLRDLPTAGFTESLPDFAGVTAMLDWLST